MVINGSLVPLLAEIKGARSPNQRRGEREESVKSGEEMSYIYIYIYIYIYTL